MTKLSRQNVGGIDYTMVGCTLTGVCASAASDYVKIVTLSDGDILADGMTVAVTFANGNTAGTAPASLTIYSSDQVNYYSDSGLTQPFTLAPSGCYEIEYTGTGNAYTYTSYPVIQIAGVTAPVCDSCGKKTSGAVWDAGDTVLMLYSGGKFMIVPGLTEVVTTGSKKAVTSGGVAQIQGKFFDTGITDTLATRIAQLETIIANNKYNTFIVKYAGGVYYNYYMCQNFMDYGDTSIIEIQGHTGNLQIFTVVRGVVTLTKNYTPIDSVSNGDSRPVTSNAVFNKTRFEQVFVADGATVGTIVVYVLMYKVFKSTSNYFIPMDMDVVASRGGIQICLLGNVKLVGYYDSTSVKAHWEYMNGNRNESMSLVKVTYNNETYLALKLDTSTTDAIISLHIRRNIDNAVSWRCVPSTDIANETAITNSPLIS